MGFIKNIPKNSLCLPCKHLCMCEDCCHVSSIDKCPICRKDIDVETVGPIFGSTDKCSVCLENNVEIYFPKCGHANTCNICFETLKTIIPCSICANHYTEHLKQYPLDADV